MFKKLEDLPICIREHIISYLFPTSTTAHNISLYQDIFNWSRVNKGFRKEVILHRRWKTLLQEFVKNNFILTEAANYCLGFEQQEHELLKIIVLNFELINDTAQTFLANSQPISSEYKNKLKKMHEDLTQRLADHPRNPILLTLMGNYAYLLNDYTNVFVFGIQASQLGILNCVSLQYACTKDIRTSLSQQKDSKIVYKTIKVPVIEDLLKECSINLTFNDYMGHMIKKNTLLFEEFHHNKNRSNHLEIALFNSLMNKIKPSLFDTFSLFSFDPKPLVLSEEEMQSLREVLEKTDRSKEVGFSDYLDSLIKKNQNT